MAEQDRTFSPTEVEANRAAQQGLGVGQRELDAQRDPGEPAEQDFAAEAEDDEALSAEDRRLLKVESELGQGSRTRQHQKDAVSRRV